MMKINRTIMSGLAAAAALFSATTVNAQTTNSPTGGPLPAGVTAVGGVVLDLKGSNGVRVVSQLAASQTYVGFANSQQNGSVAGTAAGNPLLFGTQTGFTPGILSALGGGLLSASIRITLFDGDTQAGNFDFNDNTFFAGGVSFGNWSSVATVQTDGLGVVVPGSASFGFGDNILSTGFFSTTNAASLSSLFTALGSGSLAYTLSDVDPYDNFYDFTQGIDGGLINVGTGPVIAPGVPEPSTWMMLIAGFGATGFMLRRRRSAVTASFA